MNGNDITPRVGGTARLDTVLSILGAMIVVIFACAFSPCEQSSFAATPLWKDPETAVIADLMGFSPTDAAMLVRVMDRAWEHSDDPAKVPNIGPLSMPVGLDRLTVAQRKEVFMRSVLPHVLYANRLIGERREKLESVLVRLEMGNELDTFDRAFLDETASRYRLAEKAQKTMDGDPLLLVHALMERVDEIPPSLVLAQAAMESAWGTSRFVQEGNNLFGQWVFSKSGMAPKGRDKEANYSVARYENLAVSVAAYTRNLNTLWAYQEFRDIRTRMRSSGTIFPQRLAQGLLRYSIRRQAYVDEIQAMIRSNQLECFDDARLMELQMEAVKASLSDEQPLELSALGGGLDV